MLDRTTLERPGGGPERFSGPVTLRRGGSRTIGGRVYLPGHAYAPDDPGVLQMPQFFILAKSTDRAEPDRRP